MRLYAGQDLIRTRMWHVARTKATKYHSTNTIVARPTYEHVLHDAICSHGQVERTPRFKFSVPVIHRNTSDVLLAFTQLECLDLDVDVGAVH